MSRVIRSKSRVISAEIVDALEKANEIIDRAQQQAAEILKSAKQQAETIRADATAAGAEAGIAESAMLLESAARQKQSALAKAEETIVRLAIESASRVVHEVAGEHPDRIRGVVRELLKRAERASRITILAHPEDVPRISSIISDELAFEVEANDGLSIGECVVKTDIGDFDARLDVQLAALQAALLKSQT